MNDLDGDRDGDEAPVINRGGLHQLRQALLKGGREIERAAEQVLLWAPNVNHARSYLDCHLRVSEPESQPVTSPIAETLESAADPATIQFSRILGAVDLLDMRAGTDYGNNRPKDAQDVGAMV
jgi:hypothetical protein